MEGSGKSEILVEFSSRELIVEKIIAALENEIDIVGISESSDARTTSLTKLIYEKVRAENVFQTVIMEEVRDPFERKMMEDQIGLTGMCIGERSGALVNKNLVILNVKDPIFTIGSTILDVDFWRESRRACKFIVICHSPYDLLGFLRKFKSYDSQILYFVVEEESEIIDVTTAADIKLFCLLFPSGYEFTEDMLVCQWIAEELERGIGYAYLEELVEMGQSSWGIDAYFMKDVYVRWFQRLLEKKYIVPSGYDYRFDQVKYKVGEKMKDFLQNQPMDPKFKKDLDSKKNIEKKVERLSLASKKIDGVDFNILKQYGHLRTLILYHCYGSKLKRLPTNLFFKLESLMNLNLSHTDIVELPSSLENLTGLIYLEVSHTPIMWLPESLGHLSLLLMINLDGCLSLTSLPKCTRMLVNLCHLVFDVERQLESMPIGIGMLENLHTLQSFLVGKADGYRIEELEKLNRLQGSFRILNLENVMTEDEASKACLHDKSKLTKIELRWSDRQNEKNLDEEQILESLQPPPGIQEVKISFYNGGVLPTWISNPSFSEMVSITLYGCRCYSHLPSLGELPNLEVLNIFENNEVIKIKSDFCRKKVDKHHEAFPKLEKLSLNSMSKLESWSGVGKTDFPLLRDLTIKYCPKFKTLPPLSHMMSLQCMEIHGCPELSHLPKVGMSGKLECLMIGDCPKLKAQYGNEKCKDWSKVAHVRAIYIDDEEVSK